MPSFAVVHGNLQSWTVSCRRFIVVLVTSSMDGTTPACCSTSLFEEVDIRTHGIIHLKYHMEVQDTELEERAEMIIDLEQQLLEL
jgi:hypothetical protein